MMQRAMFGCLLVGVLLGSLPLAAQDAPVPDWTCSDDFQGQTLHMANWSSYIARDTISDFEALCDVKIIYTEFDDDIEILTQLREGTATYDLVIPDNSTVGVMIEEGLLEELDHTNLPNLTNLDPIFDTAAYDVGHVYSVPYQWGTVGVGYRKSAFPTPPTSWNDVFAYEGPMVWLDYARPLIGIALLVNGDDPTSGDPADLARARNFLIDHSDQVILLPDSTAQDALLNGDVDLIIENSGDILDLNKACNCDEFAYLIPEEGSNIWVDSMVIPVDAENKPLAEAFIDYILDPVVSANISNETKYATPNKIAIDNELVHADLLNNKAIYPFHVLREKMFFLKVLTPEESHLYADAWSELRILIGDRALSPSNG
jgi:spermidine/putrescine transport system substrate-binding protein